MCIQINPNKHKTVLASVTKINMMFPQFFSVKAVFVRNSIQLTV